MALTDPLICKRKAGAPGYENGVDPCWERLFFGRIEVCWMGWPWRMACHPALREPRRLWGMSCFFFGYRNSGFPCLHLGSLVIGWCNDDYWRTMLWDVKPAFGRQPPKDVDYHHAKQNRPDSPR